jgi:hypothetical protein
MPRLRRHWLIAVLLLLVLSPFAVTATRAQFQPHAETLLDAWKLAERAERYRFTSQVTQKMIPAPQLVNVGQPVDEEHLTVQGNIDRAADRLDLALWDSPATAFDPAQAIEFRIEGGLAQGRVPGGEWSELDDFAGDTFAPGGDVAAYLLAARHVTYLGTERRDLAPFADVLISRRYHFAIDGDALARIMAAQLEDEMRRKGELPPGVYLGTSDQFRQLVGVGEAWIGEDGLPQRLTVEIEFPQQQNGERQLVSVQTDFHDFDRSWLSVGGSALTNRWLLLQSDLARVWDIQQMTAALLFVLLLGATAFLLSRLPYRSRQTVVSLAVLFVLLGTEISKAAPLPSQMAAALAAQPQSAPAQRPQPTPEPTFDNRQSPLGRSAPLITDPGIYSRSLFDPTTLDPQLQDLVNGPDTDRDGLSDELEAIWGTDPTNPDTDGDGLTDGMEVGLCAELLAGPVNGKLTGKNATAPACANPISVDTDGDGLTDFQEVRHLGTSPNSEDSDSDGLLDPVEVQGFLVAGVRRYTDPLNPDTDGDGLTDGQECPGGFCIINSRGTGDPDVFVIDNDGDGFIGSFDLSPNVVLGKETPFTSANPFQLSLANLNPDKSVFVDFQIRPTDPNQIGYAQSVLDWPSGDTDGQVQRRLGTTFADANPLPVGMAAPDPYPAANGDMRLVPMLEIEMPATAAPLPRTAATTTVPLANTPLLATVQIIKQVEPYDFLGFTIEPEALRVRVNYLNPDYPFNSYTLEIFKGACQSLPAAPVFPIATLSQNGEVTYADGEYAVIGDGGHVAVLKATNLTPNCLPIPKVTGDATQTPLNFLAPPVRFGNLQMTQVGERAIELTLTDFDNSDQHTVEIFEGSCQELGFRHGSPLPMTPDVAQTLGDNNLVELADGDHVALLKRGTRTLTCAPLGNIVNGAQSEVEMIDQAALTKMGITVSEEKSDGTLVARIPLNVAQDPRTGITSGFAATMLYDTDLFTGPASWQHNVRMSWWVQVLTDNCSTPSVDSGQGLSEQVRLTASCGSENVNQLRLVHVYDGEWMLAGMSVREEHDYDMNIIFEDPTSDANRESDNYLWHLAKGLDEQFVTGVDCVRVNPTDGCGSDGHRDYTLAKIYTTWDKTANSAVSETNRWGIPASTFRVEKLGDKLSTYVDMGLVMSTHVPDLLKTHFLDNGTPRAAAPMLLFASENHFRSVTLGTANYATPNTDGVTIDFAPNGQDPQTVVTIASLSWAPYRYNTTGGRWESYPFAEYWDLLELRLKESNAFGDGATEDDRIIGEGMRLIAKSYFTYLYHGRANLVQSGDTPLGLLDSSAALYLSLQERTDAAFDVADDISTATGTASLINIVVQPLAQNLMKEFSLRSFQLEALANPKTRDVMQSILASGLAPFDTSYRGALRNTFRGLGDDLNQSFVQGVKLGSRGATGATIGVAGAVVLLGIAAAITVGVRGDGGGAVARQVFGGIGAGVSVVTLATLAHGAREATKGVAGLAAKAAVLNQQAATVSKSALRAGLVALVIVELINYAGLIANIAGNGYSVFSLQANQLFAEAVASTITAVLAFALSSTGVGAAIVAVIGLIDSLIAIACGFWPERKPEDEEGNEAEVIAREVFCRGITGWITEIISFGIYSQNHITQINDPYRLNFRAFRPGLAEPADGFVPNAGLTLELSLRNTLALSRLPLNLGITYGLQFNEETLRKARFAYDIVTVKPAEDAPKLSDRITLGGGPSPWQSLAVNPDSGVVAVYQDETERENGLLLPAAPGINQKVPVFLAEGYQVPVQECILVSTFPVPPLPYPICWVRSDGTTNYNDLNLAFDIFPPTLAEFRALSPVTGQPGRYRLAWANNRVSIPLPGLGITVETGLDFPPLIDADGDGLPWNADSDDTRWDTDGDGLSDAVEKARGTDPGDPDSDGDGLSDAEEALWKTDPNNPDSDGDGLSDREEVIGWSVAYGTDSNGNVLMSWTRSNPLSRDGDGDNILDSKEKVLGFSPFVANTPQALRYDTALGEPQAPLLLTRFDERKDAATFADSSGSTAGNVASCKKGICPTSGVQGRFGNAVHFNGVDQFLTIPPNPAIGAMRTDYTLSAWVKPVTLTGVQAVIQIGPGGPNGTGGVTFGLSDANLFVRFEGGSGTFTQILPADTLRLNAWNHITAEIYIDQGYLYFSVNGQAFGGDPSFVKPVSLNPVITIGAAQQPSSNTPPDQGSDTAIPLIQVEHFAGTIDDVLIQNWVPQDTSSIQALFAGRYNINDLIFRPGQEVDYRSTLENSLLARRISGQRQINYPAQLTDASSGLSPFVLDAAQRVTYSDDFTVASTAASGKYTITQRVDGAISIPAEDVWRNPAGNQIFAWAGPENYAGASGTSSGSQTIDLNSRSFTIAAWVRPTAGDTTRRGILGRNSGQNNAFPYLLTEGRKLKFGFGRGSSLTEVTATDGANTDVLNLQQWNFIAVRYNLTGGSVTFFVNDKKLDTVATNTTPNSAFTSFFIGRASNLGKVTLNSFLLTCEGDGAGDGEYDFIGNGENLARRVGTEPAIFPLNVTRTFNESFILTVCEDDDGVNNVCGSSDENMGSIVLSTNQTSQHELLRKFAI